MKYQRTLVHFALIIGLFLITGCSVVSAFSPTETPTQTPLPTSTSTPTVTPTATEIPFYLDATVWDYTLQVPILIYHQFVPDDMNTDATQMRFADFKEELQLFYDNGYSLIPLKGWLEGNFIVPVGRKPLIITLDDLWFGNQIYINEDGTPSLYSGIGILWQFSQEHPDFGFHAALFAINGDKFYPEKQVGDGFQAAENVDFYSKSWHIKLGNTIAWAIQNGIEVYSHTFQHPSEWKFSGVNLTNAEVLDQLKKNDFWLREFLTESGHEDLIPQLDNMIALPEGKWPESESGKKVLLDYTNPEGKPVLAVMEAYNMDAAQLTLSAYADGFDPFHIARITASKYMTQFIVESKDQVPTMMACRLGPMDEAQASNPEVISDAILSAINSQSCPEGVYNVGGSLFLARGGTVTLQKSADEKAALLEPTLTPTLNP